jgi:hypothetical protein
MNQLPISRQDLIYRIDAKQVLPQPVVPCSVQCFRSQLLDPLNVG